MPTTEPAALLMDQDVSAVYGGVAYLNDLERRLAPSFERAEPRQRAMASLRGLRSSAERKHSWPWAESSGDATPYAFQHLLRRALGDPEAVLVLDETGFPTQGRHSAGVARQYRGTTGTVDHGQIGVCLGDASRRGHVLLDRELYLPQEWTDDRARCQQAGIPEDRPVATKPPLARQMLARALTAGMSAPWVTGDRVYGNDRRRRLWWEAQPRPTCWPSRVRSTSGWAGDNARSTRAWPLCRRRAGRGSVQAMARQVPGGTTGAGCPWPSPWSLTGAVGCWYGAA
jgi:hypothetical protein